MAAQYNYQYLRPQSGEDKVSAGIALGVAMHDAPLTVSHDQLMADLASAQSAMDRLAGEAHEARRRMESIRGVVRVDGDTVHVTPEFYAKLKRATKDCPKHTGISPFPPFGSLTFVVDEEQA